VTRKLKITRVTVFREESGAVGLSGRDLPAAQALSGHANVQARARQYETSGAFAGQTASRLEALAYLHLLNGVTAEDAIAFARTADTQPPDEPEHDDADAYGRRNATPKLPDVKDRGESDTAQDQDDRADSAADGGGPENYRDGHTSVRASPAGRRDHEEPDGDGDPGSGLGPGDSDEGPDGDEEPDGDGGSPGGGLGPDGDGSGSGRTGRRPTLPEVIVPLATLLGQAERPGENRLLGPLDPAIGRELAAAAARSPDSRWQVTVVDSRGYAIGTGVARTSRSGRRKARPPGQILCAFPAWVNITVTEDLVQQLLAQPRSGAPPGDWELTPRTINNENGLWTLTLPGGRELSVRFDVIPTHTCDHRHQVDSYQPGERLRRLVQVRDYECTFPTCSRPANDSDFEHAIPYDQGGRTDACNAGARSRRCHQVKQLPGWKVIQPKPGWHEWTTPTGRTYVQEPWRYPA
jgi:hypothetical protein